MFCSVWRKFYSFTAEDCGCWLGLSLTVRLLAKNFPIKFLSNFGFPVDSSAGVVNLSGLSNV